MPLASVFYPLKKHSVSGWFFRILLIIVSILCVNSALRAQAMKTGKSVISQGKQVGVTGIVESGTGLVQVRIYPGTNTSPILSFANKSFLTFLINGNRYFTNNDIGFPIQSDTKLLTDGILSQIQDTIRCTWFDAGKSGVDLIQEIYPVVFEKSEQIVFRWKAFNHNSVPAAVALQYLLDLNINGNDKAKVLTRSGYRPDWFQFNNNPDSVPPFYIGFEFNLPNPPTFNPGLSGQGYLDNTYYNLGLTKPSRMTIGEWPILITQVWGPAAGAGPYGDVAILFEFPGGGVQKDQELTLASTSYGTGEFERCIGTLFALEFYPHRIKWVNPNLVPNPFTIDMYTFNPDKNKGAPNTSVTLNVDSNLTIVSPTPVTNNGRTQTQPIANGGFIPPLGVGFTTWNVRAEKVDCLGNYLRSLKFTASSGIGYPIFQNEDTLGSGNSTDTCEHYIRIDCAQLDYLKPIIEKFVYDTATFTTTFNTRDNRTKDRGLKSISWAPVNGTDSNNFPVSVIPIVPCDKNKDHLITIRQKDSTIAGCIDFTIIDCVNLHHDTTICFPAHPVAPTPDILPPLFSFVERSNKYDTLEGDCNSRFDSLIVTDSRLLDKGLLALRDITAPKKNMQLRALPITSGDAFNRFSVSVIDSFMDGMIILEAEDVAHNFAYDTITYCSRPDPNKPKITITASTKIRGQWDVEVWENRIWDRLIDSIWIVSYTNIKLPVPILLRSATKGKNYFEFGVTAADTSQPSGFCVQASDLFGNIADEVCVTQGIDKDILPPNISISGDIPVNPWRVKVNLDDIHKDINGNVIPWDKGIDSVWYSATTEIQTPGPILYPCIKTPIPSFELFIIDTLKINTKACVTIYVRDCAGNVSNAEWCYNYFADNQSPNIRGQYTSRSSIDFTITDNLLSDRGNGTFDLIGDVNLTPSYKGQDISRKPTHQFTLNRALNTSSIATIQSTDFWGNSLAPAKAAHTASVEFGIFVQNAGMRKGMLIRDPGMFEIPVSLAETDTFALSKKGINEFEFTFAINGDVSAVNFNKVRTDSTLSDGWSVTATLTGNIVNIHGVKTVSDVSLHDTSNGKTTLPLVRLQFDAKKDETTRSITLDPMKIGAQATETILYNNGQDTTYSGKNATATMPATYGVLSGSHIVILGACAPSLLQGSAGKTTIVTLNQNSPNPFSEKTNLQYTVREEGLVRLAVYDMLGRRVTMLVDETQPQGAYTIDFNARGLDGGSYVVRLEANGVVRSRMISLQK